MLIILDNFQIVTDSLLTPGQLLLLETQHYEHPIEGLLMHINDKHMAVAVENLPDNEYSNTPPAGINLVLRFSGKQGHFEAETRFLGNSPLPQKLFFLERPSQIRSNRQREYFRVPTSLFVMYRTKNAFNIYTDMKRSTLVDISGNGLCFIADTAINRSTKVFLLINGLPGIDQLPITATVVRCRQIRVSAGYIYHIGVSFDDCMPNQMHNQLLGSLSKMQQNLISKGKY